MSASRMPSYFISHGGGPWPWMHTGTEHEHAVLEASLADIPGQLPQRPRAVLMVSAHWEEAAPAIMAAPTPGMLYDYYGFPEHTYKIRYGAPGDTLLAMTIRDALRQAGFAATLDPTRGFDHGTFVPMSVMYPQADMPVVQLSLRRDLDVQAHLDMGRTLAPLREQGVLIIGSGLSYHNLRLMGPEARTPSLLFDTWLQQTLHADPATRLQRVQQWELAPAARIAHPREDHLLPLMVALGAAEYEVAHCIYHEETFFGGVAVSSFRFGGEACA